MTEQEIIKRAKDYGYSTLFARRDSIVQIQDYIDKFPASDRAGLYTVMGLTLNTMAYNIAKSELEESSGQS